VLGEAPLLLLREDQPLVGAHVELALLAFDRLGFETLAIQLGRETRGPFVVTVSDRAVENCDAHAADRTG